MIDAVDLTNKHLDPQVDYTVVGMPTTLRGLVEQGLSDDEIGRMANCAGWTVRRWRLLFGIKRAPVRKAKAPPRLTLAQRRVVIRLAVARWFHSHLDVCRTDCLRRNSCRKGCPFDRPGYDPKEDVSNDPWWD